MVNYIYVIRPTPLTPGGIGRIALLQILYPSATLLSIFKKTLVTKKESVFNEWKRLLRVAGYTLLHLEPEENSPVREFEPYLSNGKDFDDEEVMAVDVTPYMGDEKGKDEDVVDHRVIQSGIRVYRIIPSLDSGESHQDSLNKSKLMEILGNPDHLFTLYEGQFRQWRRMLLDKGYTLLRIEPKASEPNVQLFMPIKTPKRRLASVAGTEESKFPSLRM